MNESSSSLTQWHYCACEMMMTAAPPIVHGSAKGTADCAGGSSLSLPRRLTCCRSIQKIRTSKSRPCFFCVFKLKGNAIYSAASRAARGSFPVFWFSFSCSSAHAAYTLCPWLARLRHRFQNDDQRGECQLSGSPHCLCEPIRWQAIRGVAHFRAGLCNSRFITAPLLFR